MADIGRSIAEILAPQVIAERISRMALVGTTLQRLFGWNLGEGVLDDQSLNGALMFTPGATTGQGIPRQGNVRDWDLRSGQYDTFDNTRRVATGRVPGTAASRQQPQKVGEVQFTLPRTAEVIPLTDENLQNRRAIGGPSSEVDQGGQDYISFQMMYMAQRVANEIEFQTAAMLRGSYTFTQKGDDLEHTFSGGETTIDFQIPSGNKDRLNMLGGGNLISASWATAGTDIPSDLANINAAMVQLTGKGLAHVVLNNLEWQNVVNNTKVHTQGGSANVVFERLTRARPGEFEAILRSLPWITWHIVDYGVELWDGSNFTFAKMIPDNRAAFFPAPENEWVNYIRGGEWVTEGPNGVKSFQHGFYPYSWPSHDPSGWNLAGQFNGLPALKVPACIAFGTTSGF